MSFKCGFYYFQLYVVLMPQVSMGVTQVAADCDAGAGVRATCAESCLYHTLPPSRCDLGQFPEITASEILFPQLLYRDSPGATALI